MRTTVPVLLILCFVFLGETIGAQSIVIPERASALERFAAREIRRYIYLRSGELLDIHARCNLPPEGDVIAVGSSDAALFGPMRREWTDGGSKGEFAIRSLQDEKRTVLFIVGNTDQGALYAAYRFAEHLGVGFGLAGDAIPDEQVALELSGFDEIARPRFDTRGVIPYHDFFAGPDAWSGADYLSFVSQLPKLGMNFTGFHTYSTRYGSQWARENDYRTGPEPTVWVGLPQDLRSDGTVAWSYPATYAHTDRERTWGLPTWDTSRFHAGASQVFPNDGAGAPLVGPEVPETITESNAVFDRVGSALHDAFTLAEDLGVQTAVGTELPLGLEPAGRGKIDPPEDWMRGMPRELQQRLREGGMDPAAPETVREVSRGIFERIVRTHPLDYYWLWSYEIWSQMPDGPGVTREQIEAIERDIEIAREVLAEMGNPFDLAHAAWKLGTAEDPAELESAFPPRVPFYSSWGEAAGYGELSPERVKWPGIHLEQDWGLVQWQGGVFAAWEDISAAQRVGAEGSVGNLWRTRILGPNIYGVRDLHWAYGSSRRPPEIRITGDMWEWTEGVYRRWANRQFGEEVGTEVGTILSAVDGQFPTPSGWTDHGPGEVMPNSTPWRRARRQYAFVDELEALRPLVRGVSNLDRFDYWLKTMQLLRVMGEYGTVRHSFEREMTRGRYEAALAERERIVELHERVITLQLERATNASDLGEIIHFELVNWKAIMLDRWEEELRRGLGRPIPDTAYPSVDYSGEPRVFVTPAPTRIAPGASLTVRAIVLGSDDVPVLRVGRMGSEDLDPIPMRRLAPSIYTAEIASPEEAIEYYVGVDTPAGERRWPAAAPRRNHTVIVGP